MCAEDLFKISQWRQKFSHHPMLYVSCAGAVCVCVYVADYLIWSCVRAVVDKGVDASGLKIRNGKLGNRPSYA